MDEQGESITVNCSNCRTPLVEVWTSETTCEFITKIVVDCPHCEQESYVTEIFHKCFIGGTDFTSIDSFDIDDSEDGVLKQTVYTSKVKKYG